MKRFIFALIAVLVASTAFACKDDENVEYKKIHSDSKKDAFVVVGSQINNGSSFTVTAKIQIFSTKKKMNTCVKEDYVINCDENTYHIANSTSYYNGKKTGFTAEGEEENIEGAYLLKLKSLYCTLNKTESIEVKKAEEENCMKLSPTGNRKWLEWFAAQYNMTVCSE